MRHKRLKLSAVLLLGLGLTGLQAQEAIPTSSGEASGSGGSASFSVGQVFSKTNTGTNGSVAEGVQQPYEISVVSGIEDAKDISLICSVYPNPTKDFLTLKVENYPLDELRYHIYDIQGKLLESKIVTADQTGIEMDKFTPATYLLKVIHNNIEVKTFRIIKK
jgi:hypothetical protein